MINGRPVTLRGGSQFVSWVRSAPVVGLCGRDDAVIETISRFYSYAEGTFTALTDIS